MALSTFRRSAKSEAKKGGGKGPRGNWRENFRLPQGTPAAFALIAGDYIDPDPNPDTVEIDVQTGQPIPAKLKYYKWLKHRLKTVNQKTGKQLFIDEPCAKGWDKHSSNPCPGCYAMDSGDKRITLSPTFSIGLVHLAVYHRHPIWDAEKNSWIVKKEKNEPIFIETECYGKTCNFCKFLSGQPPILKPGDVWPPYPQGSITQVFASRRYLELGSGHLNDLGEWDRQLGSRCGGTAYVRNQDGTYMLNQQGQPVPKGRCDAFLDVDGYACPYCNNMLINAETDPRPLEQLDQVAMTKYPCHHCQKPVFMKEINSCSSCGKAVVNNIFDGILWGQRQGEGTQSHMVLAQFDTIEDYESKMTPELRQLLAGKTLRERINELSKPYEFSELYKPKSPEAMAKRLEIALPQGFVGAQPTQSFYGQPAAPMQQGQAPAWPAAPGQPVAPAYTPYGTQSGPGPAPFVPPVKPNFGN